MYLHRYINHISNVHICQIWTLLLTVSPQEMKPCTGKNAGLVFDLSLGFREVSGQENSAKAGREEIEDASE